MSTYRPEDLRRVWKTEMEIYQAIAAICERHGLRYYAAYGTAIGAVRHRGFIPWDDDMDVCMPRKDYEAFLEVAEKELPAKMGIEGIGYTEGFVMPMVKIVNRNTVFVEESDADKRYRSGIFVDIFPMDAAAPTEKLRKKHRRRCLLMGRCMVLSEYSHGKLPAGMNPLLAAAVRAGCALVHGCLRLTGWNAARLNRIFYREATRYEPEGDPEVYVLMAYFSEFATEYVPSAWLFPTREVPFEDITVRIPKDTDACLRNYYGDYMQIPPPEQRHDHCPVVLEFEKE